MRRGGGGGERRRRGGIEGRREECWRRGEREE